MSQSHFPSPLVTKAHALINACRHHEKMIVTAESCTGGLLAGLLTEIAGSSAVVERGFVTYSNEAKTELIGTPAALISSHGAVSSEVAHAMAQGALRHSRAHISLAITGIAGPDGGTTKKPVGLVHFATSWRSSTTSPIEGTHHFEARYEPISRSFIRTATLDTALELLAESLRRI